MVNKIDIAKLGSVQTLDVRHSRKEVYDNYFRTCTVLQESILDEQPPYSDIGDTSPYRIAKLYGGDWYKWNRQFVVQVADCPFKCWYCYVDNLKPGLWLTPQELISSYKMFRSKVPNLNVFHFMGGCPGRYSYLWKEIRNEMDKQGLEDCVFLTDVILVEELFYQQKPWNDIPHMSIVQVCLKGTNFENFKLNTGLDLFHEAISEVRHYIRKPQVYFAIIEQSLAGVAFANELFGYENVDRLHVKRYEVVKRRRKQHE